jgi:hypothetical protein
MIDIYVGKNLKHYTVPKDILCYHLSYFDRCFNGHFKEAIELKLIPPDDAVKDFEIILDFVLTGRISTMFEIIPDDVDENPVKECIEFIEYAEKPDLAGAGMAVYENIINMLSGQYATNLEV